MTSSHPAAPIFRSAFIEVVTIVVTSAIGAGILASGISSGMALSGGMVAGALVGLLNFRGLYLSLSRTLSPANSNMTAAAGLKGILPFAAVLRFGVFAGIVYLAISRWRLDPRGIAIGFSVFVATLIVAGFMSQSQLEAVSSDLAAMARFSASEENDGC